LVGLWNGYYRKEAVLVQDDFNKYFTRKVDELTEHKEILMNMFAFLLLSVLSTSYAQNSSQDSLKQNYENKKVIDKEAQLKSKAAANITQCLRKLVRTRDLNMESLLSAVRLLEIARKSPQTSKDLHKIEQACDAALTASSFCTELVDIEDQLKFLNVNSTKIRPEFLKYLTALIAPSDKVFSCYPVEYDVNVAFVINLSARSGREVCVIESGEVYFAHTLGIGLGKGIGASLAKLSNGERNNENSYSRYVHFSNIFTFGMGPAFNSLTEMPFYTETEYGLKDIKGAGVGVFDSNNLNFSVPNPLLGSPQNDYYSAKIFLAAVKKE
jgi:hypothetical protein